MVSEKFKVLGVSDSPNVITGYANMSRNLFTRLQDDERFDLSFLGLQYSGQPTEYMKLENGPLLKFRMLPTGSARFGEDSLPFYLKKYQPDLTYVLLDSFMVQWMMNLDWSPTKMLMHFPSDGFPIPAGSEDLMKKFDYVVAMSKFAQKQLVDLGIDAEYIPAGVNTNEFYPLSFEGEKQKNRIKWSERLGIDLQNKFIIGAVGRLQGRKFYGELFKAVEKFVEDKNDVVLLIHADPNDPANPGFIMPHLLNLRKLEHMTRFTGQQYTFGFTEKDLNELYNLFDVYALSTCLTPEMLIQTEEGVKEIKKIKKGEKVLTKEGTYEKVLKVNKFKHKDKIIKIKPDGLPEFKCTLNHKIFVVRKPKNKSDIDSNSIIEIPAGNICKGDFVVYPKYLQGKYVKEISTKKYLKKGRNQFGTTFKNPRARGLPAKIQLDKDFGLLAGWYLSEGCSTKDGVVLAFNTKEKEHYFKLEKIIHKLIKCSTKIDHLDRNRTVLKVYNVAFGRLMKDLFGANSHKKKFPVWVKDTSNIFQRSLLRGLWQGDGHYEVDKRCNSNVFELQTVSKQMAWDCFNLLIQHNFKPTIASQQRQSLVWRIRMNGNQGFGEIYGVIEKKQIKKTRIHRDLFYVYYPVFKINEEEYEGDIYDLTVNNNHTYVSHCLIHNSGEGFGIPIIEAMSCEVPSVLTDFTTTQEIVTDNKCGIAVPIMNTITGTYNVERGIIDVDKFVESLQFLYDNPVERKRLGKNGRTAAIKHYDYDKVVYPAWNKYLLKVLDE